LAVQLTKQLGINTTGLKIFVAHMLASPNNSRPNPVIVVSHLNPAIIVSHLNPAIIVSHPNPSIIVSHLNPAIIVKFLNGPSQQIFNV